MRRLILIVSLLIAGSCAMTHAQRRITPVNPNIPGNVSKKNDKTTIIDRTRLEERMDANGNIVLIDTVTGLEFVDSTAIKQLPKLIYPLFHGVTFGVNIWDPMMRLLGQEYGGIDFWGELSLHNRYKPVVEIGAGSIDTTPDGMNYTYKSGLAPYFKIGMNYNVFYNSNPDYQLCVGARYGFSSFKWEVTDVYINPGYWQTPEGLNFPKQTTTAGYLEIVFSIKVKIWKNISAGWALKYHSITNESKSVYGEPMYIPGFGKRSNALSGGFSIMYSLPLNKERSKTVDKETTE